MVDNETIQSIASQTNISDVVLIRHAYEKNNKDVVATIMDLMSIKDTTRLSTDSRPRSYVDEVREILAEKEQLFREYCESQSKKVAI